MDSILKNYFGQDLQDLQDYSLVSDDVAEKFNGVYIGMYATSSGMESKNIAKFDWFFIKGND